MADDDPNEGRPDDGNPFKGTPFEQIFGAMGGGMPGGGQMPDLSQLFGQLQSLLQPYDGPLNWDVALDLARKTVAQSPDPTPSAAQQGRVADAVQLADHWLDATTDFPSGVSTATAWSRAEWIVSTLDVWKVLVEPVAQQSVGAMGSALPEGAQARPRRSSASSARRSVRCWPTRSAPGSAPSPARCSRSPTSASRSRPRVARRWCRPTWRRSRRAST
jgi:hypothetical protein